MEGKNEKIIRETWRKALYLWSGLSLCLTLFFVQSQMFFIRSKPLPYSRLEWVFSVLGVMTFFFGLTFFKFFTKLRIKKFRLMTAVEVQQSLLFVFVLQFILFETLGLYGILLSVLSQNGLRSLPFIVFAYLGFILAFPKKKKIEPFF